MLPNRNLCIHNAHTLGPLPTLPCPHCPRHFRSKGGRTKHIQARHAPEPHEPNLSLPPSPASSSSQLSYESPNEQLQSSISSDPAPSLPPSQRGFNADVDMDVEDLHFDQDHIPPAGEEPNENAPPVSHVYHPKLNGQICDVNGNDIPPDTPPPPRDLDRGPHNWMPYNNCLQFEVADFLFRRNQMSAGDINSILSLWAASLAIHNDEPPFSNATDLYNTIDSTPLGDLAWESFSLQYNGTQPASNVPSWMQAEYDSGFDYAPFQEYTTDGVHCFWDFMSANWAWHQVDIIAEDPETHGSVFCPIILGSDKTTVSVATGHNEYWPVYLSIGNIHNNV
ncbi:hypothetical protein BYT27DRAFT_7250153 [Phlegmacium glaucopus]|nr:hypothetical protein BYT27DRAFT_7250153 [Phlegmacium glaucopus]